MSASTDANSGPGTVTRAYRYALDVTPSQDRLLRSYCGSARFAYNWALGRVKDNLAARAKELAEDVPELPDSASAPTRCWWCRVSGDGTSATASGRQHR